MITIGSSEELIDLIREREIIVYGTGFVSERFVRVLTTMKLDDKIKYYVETSPKQMFVRGKRVLRISSIEEYSNAVVCIAVHEAIIADIYKSLDEKGIINYVWIYPYLHDLLFGKPNQTNVTVAIGKLLDKIKNDYAIAVRIAAIDEYYGKCNCGYSIYRKTQQMHCDEKTAESRLRSFIELIKDWDTNGYDLNSRIKVTEDYQVIDGLHRLALAYYHELHELVCDIYSSENSEPYCDSNVRISADTIVNARLSDEELMVLKSRACYRRYQRKYKEFQEVFEDI